VTATRAGGRLCLAIAALALAISPFAVHAQAPQNLVEQLLALPAIQNLLQRVPELQTLSQQCGNPAYRHRNAEPCLRAEQAAALSRMPHELRVVMTNPVSARSLRELCMTAVNMGTSSWLCTELGKADNQFGEQMRQRQMEINAAQPG